MAEGPTTTLSAEQARHRLTSRARRHLADDAAAERAAFEALLRVAGGDPLVIELIGRCIALEPRWCGYSAYLGRFARAKDHPVPADPAAPDALRLAWWLTRERLGEPARRMLRAAAHLAPAPVPLELAAPLAAAVDEVHGLALPAPRPVTVWTEACEPLLARGLATGGRGTFALSPAVRRLERWAAVEDGTADEWARAALLALQRADDWDPAADHLWPVVEAAPRWAAGWSTVAAQVARRERVSSGRAAVGRRGEALLKEILALGAPSDAAPPLPAVRRELARCLMARGGWTEAAQLLRLVLGALHAEPGVGAEHPEARRTERLLRVCLRRRAVCGGSNPPLADRPPTPVVGLVYEVTADG
ncbi:MAG: hypothetical protein R3F59_13255 [Myxococcota bacterium]